MRASIAVHGGVDTDLSPKYRQTVEKAASAGLHVLKNNGSALDAVQEAVVVLENSPVLDAGVGSVLCWDGKRRMNASIMDGRNLKAGAVALVEDVRNPVLVARRVMEKTDNVLLAGPFATHFAKALGLKKAAPRTESRVKEYRKLKVAVLGGKNADSLVDMCRLAGLRDEFPSLLKGGTVGAVAMDRRGNVAAAASTGGLALQLPGRVGDTPIIGAGMYAANGSGAVAVTGVGEVSIRYCAAKSICDVMKEGIPAQDAVEEFVNILTRKEKAPMGFIAVDPHGRIGMAYNTKGMSNAYVQTESTRLMFVEPKDLDNVVFL